MSVCKFSGEYFLFGKYSLFFFEWEEARSDLAARNFEAMIYMKRFMFFFVGTFLTTTWVLFVGEGIDPLEINQKVCLSSLDTSLGLG